MIRRLGAKLDKALAKGHAARAVEFLEELEALEPRLARWPHKRGDMLRKLGRTEDAVLAYERAVGIYADCGFLARAIAMAKVLLEVDPTRVDVVERVDPKAARALHRRSRPNSVRLDAGQVRDLANQAEQLRRDQRVGDRVVRFQPSQRPPTIDLELSDLELGGAPPVPRQGQTEPVPPSAERLAMLPLFPLFAEAPPEALQTLAREAELVRLGDGQLVVRTGDPADALYGIVSGAVRVVPAGAGPGEFVRLGEGEVFGEGCLLSRETRKADVLAEGDLLSLRISKQTLDLLVRVHPVLANLLLELMARRLLANLLHTSRLFQNLEVDVRKQLARAFEVRRAPAGTVLSEQGFLADGIYITLTGHLDVARSDTGQAGVVGAGVMFGQASVLSGAPSELKVTAKENLLVLRLPADAFSRIAFDSSEVLTRVAALGPVAHIAA